jgi:transcriptional regulator with XRE-family HTH domain
MARPAHVGAATSGASVFERALRDWRLARRRTQLELALDAEVSRGHVSNLETGRSKPSRQMVLLLASILEVPLRDSTYGR